MNGIRHHNEPIPDGKLKQFDELLKACNGRYLGNPYETHDQWGRYRASFEFDLSEDSNKFGRLWGAMNTPIVEIRKDQLWRRILRRFKIWK